MIWVAINELVKANNQRRRLSGKFRGILVAGDWARNVRCRRIAAFPSQHLASNECCVLTRQPQELYHYREQSLSLLRVICATAVLSCFDVPEGEFEWLNRKPKSCIGMKPRAVYGYRAISVGEDEKRGNGQK